MRQNILAVDIGGTAVKCALVSRDFRLLEKRKFDTPYGSAEALVHTLQKHTKCWEDMFDLVGVCMPGTIQNDTDQTVLRGGSLVYMNRVPFGRLLREAFQMPCIVENDGKAAALGEYVHGALAGVDCGILLTLGTGIGGGIVLHGHVWQGTHSFAGEFSYLFNRPESLPNLAAIFGVNCGLKDLREMVAASLGDACPDHMTGEQIFALANNGNQRVLDILRGYCARIAQQLQNLQAILDPDVVAIGGGLSEQPLLLQMIREEIDRLYAVFPSAIAPPPVRITTAQQGNDANLVGAAYNCVQKHCRCSG